MADLERCRKISFKWHSATPYARISVLPRRLNDSPFQRGVAEVAGLGKSGHPLTAWLLESQKGLEDSESDESQMLDLLGEHWHCSNFMCDREEKLCFARDGLAQFESGSQGVGVLSSTKPFLEFVAAFAMAGPNEDCI